MNALLKLFTIGFIFSSTILSAQSVFQKGFDLGKWTIGNATQTSDGGYLVVGGIVDTSQLPIYSGLIFKLNSDGDTLWYKFFQSPDGVLFNSAVQSSNGNILISGRFVSGGQEPSVLIYTDSNGNELWTKKFFSGGGDAFHVETTSDGNFLLVGYYYHGGIGSTLASPYLLKIDSNCNLIWARIYVMMELGIYYAITKTSDGGFLLSTDNGYFGAGGADIYLIKIDVNGNVQWSKSYGLLGSQYVTNIIQTVDGGYLISGNSNANSLNKPFLLKITSDGNLTWCKSYSGISADDQLTGGAIIQMPNTDFLFTLSISNVNSINATSLLLIKLDAQGNTKWLNYNAGHSTLYNQAFQATDGGFVFFTTWWIGNNNAERHFLMIKTDSNGNGNCTNVIPNVTDSSTLFQVANQNLPISSYPPIFTPTFLDSTYIPWNIYDPCWTVGLHEPPKKDLQVSVSPNPSSAQINVNNTSSGAELILMDMSGHTLRRQKAEAGNTLMHTSSLLPGIYLLNYKENGKSTIFKLSKY